MASPSSGSWMLSEADQPGWTNRLRQRARIRARRAYRRNEENEELRRHNLLVGVENSVIRYERGIPGHVSTQQRASMVALERSRLIEEAEREVLFESVGEPVVCDFGASFGFECPDTES